jgi:AraC family transcriptional regulator
MEADVHILFSSDYYEICDFKCLCNECTKSKTEYNEHLSLCITRSGNFYYNAFRSTLDTYTGSILVSKPGYDYTVTHLGEIPDECTIIIFKKAFYEDIEEQLQLKAHWFFTNKDIQSLLLKTSPQLEQLHYTLLQAAKNRARRKLEMDNIVMEILEEVLSRFTNYEIPQAVPARLKKHHLVTIEKAKQYLNDNLTKNISLEELAGHCCISAFHFSRIYKTFTGYSVHQYLQLMRLKNAEMLLATALPVADIAFQSGFNSLDYFSSAFKKHYKLSPSVYRTSQKKQHDFSSDVTCQLLVLHFIK